MSAKLLKIEPEPPCSIDMIEKLTMICDWVRDDKISSVAIAVVHRDGDCSNTWSTPCSPVTLVGAVERLKYRLMRSMDDQ